MQTDIDVVIFNRIEYMDLLKKVIDSVVIKYNDRAKEIEDWKNDESVQSVELALFKHTAYNNAIWTHDYMVAYGKYDVYDCDLEYDCYSHAKYKHLTPIRTKTVLEETVTEYTTKTSIEQTWWEILCGKEIQYIETPHTKVVKKEVVKVETMGEYWVRMDAILETPVFERVYDRLMFYKDTLLTYNKSDHRATNEFISELDVLCSDLKAVRTSPDASYTLDGKTFKKYTRHLASEETTP